MALLFATRHDSLWSWNENDPTEGMRLYVSLSMGGTLYFNGASTSVQDRSYMARPLFILDIDASDQDRIEDLIFSVTTEYLEGLSFFRRCFHRMKGTDIESLIRKRFIFVIRPTADKWVNSAGLLIKNRPVTVIPLQRRWRFYHQRIGLSAWYMIGDRPYEGTGKWSIETLQSVVALHPAQAQHFI